MRYTTYVYSEIGNDWKSMLRHILLYGLKWKQWLRGPEKGDCLLVRGGVHADSDLLWPELNGT